MVIRADQTRAFALTRVALTELLQGEWLAPSYAITVMLSTAAMELLERMEESEEAPPPESEEEPAPEEG
jgi:hypothetical protein